MTSPSTLIARLAALSPRELLPERLSVEGAPLPENLDVVAVEPLSPTIWLVLLTSGSADFGCPIVEDAGVFRRARPGDGAARALIHRLQQAPTAEAVFDWRSLGPMAASGDERAMDVDQTHESIVVGEAAVVKWMVRVDPSPAPDLVSHLAATGFAAMPRPWGFVTAQRAPGRSALLASVSDYLPGAVDGWEWLVDDVARYGLNEAAKANALDPIAKVGRIIGQMHGALSRSSEVIAAPRTPASTSDVAAWRAAAVEVLRQATTEVSGEEGARLRVRTDRIAERLDTIGEVVGTPTIPIHGDLHVGQILRWDGGYAVNDFDGNPVVPAEERLRPQPAARDVAGMLQSIDHVARVVVKRREGVDARRVLRWIHEAQPLFLTAYLSGLAAADSEDLLDGRLLSPFQVEQELREFLYAERHLPRWRYVPDGALQELVP